MCRAGVIAAFVVLMGAPSGGVSAAHSATLTKGTVELTPWLAFSHNRFPVRRFSLPDTTV